jgi:hypothetical protein
MRPLFLLLLLANLAYFAWARYVSPEEAVSDPAPLKRQIEPDKLPVLPPSQLASATPTSAATPAAFAPLACIEWGGFAVAEALAAQKALEPLALGARLGERRSDETAGWWVFIPPQGNRAAALKKAAELKALGIGEFFVVQDEGRFRWSVSLGIFSSEEAAQSRLAALRERGVRTAQVGQRDTPVMKVWLRIRDSQPNEQTRLRELAAQSPGTELRACAAATPAAALR